MADSKLNILDATQTNREIATTLNASNEHITQSAINDGTNALSITSDGQAKTAMQQDITQIIQAYDTDLATGETYNSAEFTALGTNGVQIFFYADKNCTISLEQGVVSGSYKLTDTTTCYAEEACARTFMTVAPYFRISVTNIDTDDTTELVLDAAVSPMINPLPRSLSERNGNAQVVASIRGDENTNRHGWVSPTNTLSTNKTVRLAGTNFDGTTKDAVFWTQAIANDGEVVQGGEIELNTATTANSSASYSSVAIARFVVGSSLKLQSNVKFVTDVTATGAGVNVRRIGAYDATDGYFFQLKTDVTGAVFGIGTRKGGVDADIINSGSFNGNIGSTFIPDNDTYYKLEIEWTPGGAFYYVNGQLLHQTVGGHLTNKLSLPVKFENTNSGGLELEVTFDCLAAAITRLGELETNPTYKYLSGATTAQLKIGSGDLHTVVGTDTSGTLILYDGIGVTANIITSIDLSKVTGTLTFNCPFNIGLYAVTTGVAAKITVIYE